MFPVLIACLFITGLSVFITSCKKSAFDTRPQLTYKGSNSEVYPQQSLVEITLQITDKEGDIQDTIYVQKKSINGCSSATVGYRMPGFNLGKNVDADVLVHYAYGYSDPVYPGFFPSQCPGPRNDSSYLRFWVKDTEGHVSDTIQSPVLVFLK